MNRTSLRSFIPWFLDLLCAVFLLCAFNGIGYPSTDDATVIPWLLKANGQAAFPQDLVFSGEPHIYYRTYLAYMSALAALLPVPWVFLSNTLIAFALIIVALRKLVLRLAGIPVPHIFCAIVLSSISSQFLAGFYLVSPYHAHHYNAIGLALLALSLALDRHLPFRAAPHPPPPAPIPDPATQSKPTTSGALRRYSPALLALAAAAAFNPRMAAFGAAMLLFIAILEWKPALRFLTVTACLVLLVALLTGLARIFAQQTPGSDLSQIDMIRLWMYGRATWHYLPAYWPRCQFVNLALGATFMTLLCLRPLRRQTPATPPLLWLFFLAVAAMLIAVVNNTTFTIPSLVPVETHQFGPFAIAILFVFAAAFTAQRIQAGFVLSSLIPFVMLDLQARLATWTVLALVDIIRARLAPSASRNQSEAASLLALAVTIAALFIVPPDFREMSYSPRVVHLATLVLAITLALSAILHKLRASLDLRLALPVAIALIAVGGPTSLIPGFHLQSNIPQFDDWTQATDFIRQNLPTNACVVIPPAITDFQMTAQRSAFATFHHVPMSLDLFPEWAQRLQLLDYFPTNIQPATLSAPIPRTPSRYRRLPPARFQQIRQQYPFVSHCLVFAPSLLPFPTLYTNETFVLHNIPSP